MWKKYPWLQLCLILQIIYCLKQKKCWQTRPPATTAWIATTWTTTATPTTRTATTSPTKVDLPVTKPTLLDSFSFTLTEAAEKPTEAAQRPAVATERPPEFYKVDISSEHIELLSALVPDSSTKEMDDILEM